MSANRVAVTRLSREYGAVRALVDVSLDLAGGVVHALVGENGSGKTTLLEMLAGLRRPGSGMVTVNSRRLPANPVRASRLGVGLLRQHGSLLPALSVRDNFALADRGWGRSRQAGIDDTVRQALADVAVEPGLLVGALAPGLRQLVELARLRWRDPGVLLLDEPTAMVDELRSKALFGVARDFAMRGKVVLFSSHRINEVMAQADFVHVLRQGRLVLSASKRDLDRPRLLAAMFGQAKGQGLSRARGRQGRAPAKTSEVALSLQGVVCRGSREKTDLTVARGEIVGVVGLAGNGQEELVAALAGFVPVQAGTVLVKDEPRLGRKLREWGLRCVTGEPVRDTCVPGMDVGENLVLHGYDAPPYARAGNWLTDWRAVRRLGAAVAKREGLRAAAVPLSLLSGGNQRKVPLAREIERGGRVLVAHNPEAGLDIQAVTRLARRLRSAATKGLAILLFAEDFAFLDQVADRVMVMRSGALHELPREGWRHSAALALSGPW